MSPNHDAALAFLNPGLGEVWVTSPGAWSAPRLTEPRSDQGPLDRSVSPDELAPAPTRGRGACTGG